MLALFGLAGGEGGLLLHAQAALGLEAVVIAAVEHQLGVVDMQDVFDGAVQEMPVMADQQEGARIGLEVALQPQRGLAVELVRSEERRVGKEWVGTCRSR